MRGWCGFYGEIICGYLAIDLSKKLYLRAEVYVIPNEYRNKNGKADWDGVMAQIAHGKAT